jgi:hypothetical protein
MPKPLNASRGRCPCRNGDCTAIADVKRLKNHDAGALYLDCPECGVIRANSAAAQTRLDNYILGNVTWAGPDQGPESKPGATEPGPESKPGATDQGPESKPGGRAAGPGFIARAAQQFSDWFGGE